ncbi:MAG: gluconokinase [Luteimonas sp.]
MPATPHATVVIGVAGSGKTTVARALATRYGDVFVDADDFHTTDSKAMMAAGEPLTDEHREPWVGVLVRELRGIAQQGRSSVLAFSGLRALHRQRLRDSGVPMRFVYLHAAPSLIAERLAGRSGHFMPSGLLASQFDALEPPRGEADVVAVNVDGPPSQVLERVIAALETA